MIPIYSAQLGRLPTQLFNTAYEAAATAAGKELSVIGGSLDKANKDALQAFDTEMEKIDFRAYASILSDLPSFKVAYKKAAHTAILQQINSFIMTPPIPYKGGGDDGDDGDEDAPDITTRDPTSTESYKELAETVTGKLRTSLETCTEDLSRCDQEKQKNRVAIETLTANIAALQADLRTQMSNAAKGSQELTEKLVDLDSAKSSDAESTQALANATEQYKTLIAESQAKLAETDTQLKETRAKIEGLVAEVEAADKKAQENQDLIAQLNETIARLQKQPQPQPQPQAQAGGALDTHPLLALAAAISAAAATLIPSVAS